MATQVTVTEDAPCRRSLQIEVSQDMIDEKYKSIVTQHRKQAKVPGFRPGKVPEKVIQKRFEKAIMGDLKQALISEGYRASVAQENLAVVQVVDCQEGHLVLDQPYSFTVKVDVAPEFELPAYEGLRVKRSLKAVSEEQVEQSLGELLAQHSVLVDVQDRALREGDVAIVSYTATLEGQPLTGMIDKAHKVLGEAESLNVSCDDNEFLPGLGRGLLGLSVDEEREVPVTFPADFVVSELAGKEAVYRVRIKRVQERRIPEVNEEILGCYEVGSAEELREAVRQRLEELAAREERQAQTREVEDQLTSGLVGDLPASLVAEALEDHANRVIHRLVRQGVGTKEIEQHKEALTEHTRQFADRFVRLNLVLDRIADKESIEVTKQDVWAAIARQAMETGRRPEDELEALKKAGALGKLEMTARRQKTFEWVMSKIEVEE